MVFIGCTLGIEVLLVLFLSLNRQQTFNCYPEKAFWVKRVQRIGSFFVGNLDKILFLTKPVLRNGYPAKHNVEALFLFSRSVVIIDPLIIIANLALIMLM